MAQISLNYGLKIERNFCNVPSGRRKNIADNAYCTAITHSSITYENPKDWVDTSKLVANKIIFLKRKAHFLPTSSVGLFNYFKFDNLALFTCFSTNDITFYRKKKLMNDHNLIYLNFTDHSINLKSFSFTFSPNWLWRSYF